MSKIILIVVIQLMCVWCQKNGGCFLNDGTVGKCVPFLECETANTNYLETRIMSPMCPFINRVQTVCCPKMKRVQKCEFYADISTYIYPQVIGGVKTLPREYSHSALLGYRPNNEILWRCGGSLVSSRYVLTAGHCLQNTELGLVVKVRLGDLNYNSTEDDARPKDYGIERRIPHPDYKRSSHYNDIALLKLSSEVNLTPYVKPICLPIADSEPNEYIATGWGYTDAYGNPSNTLLKVKLHSFGFDDCRNSYNNYTNRKFRDGLQPSQLCAGHRTERKDTCTGDSGGPLQVQHSDVAYSYIQYGITSFGVGCAVIDFPAIYTRVFYYVDWIESVIWAPREDF